MKNQAILSPTQRSRDARRLWEICFDDPKAFIDLYFDKVYTDADTILYYDKSQPIAQLQMRPYQLMVWEQEVSMGYISGACTLPEYRGRGLMKQMMQEATKIMYERGDVLSTLIPAEEWLFGYYKRVAGYSTAFERAELALQSVPTSQQIAQAAASTDIWPHHNSAQWQIIQADLKLAGGNVLTTKHPRTCIAYLPEDEVLHILSIDGDQGEALRQIGRLKERYLSKTIILRCPSLLANDRPSMTQRPHGMLRILNLQHLLRIFASAFPYASFSFMYYDPLLPTINGYYAVNNGNVNYSTDEQGKSVTAYDPVSLANCLFSQSRGYLNLMLD